VLLIPAIDLKDGRCVRLRQGRMEDTTVFSDDPVETAGRWVAAGARRLHLVDLNGAFAGQPVNGGVIGAIAAAHPQVPIQVGGGIRDRAAIESYLSAGADRVVLGTGAMRSPRLVQESCRAFPGRIAVAIDARDGMVAVEGWAQTTATRAVDLARGLEQTGVAAINFTDIHRDGMQTGPNVDATRQLARAVSVPVVASGGVSSLEDIRRLLPLEADGVVGIITGRALYAGSVRLADAIALARGAGP